MAIAVASSSGSADKSSPGTARSMRSARADRRRSRTAPHTMPPVRRSFVWAIAILAFVECVFWLFAGLVQWQFAGFSLGPVYSPQVAEGARRSLTEFAWGALNIACLVAYYLRAWSWGRWLMAAIQLANLAVRFTWASARSLAARTDSQGSGLRPSRAA